MAVDVKLKLPSLRTDDREYPPPRVAPLRKRANIESDDVPRTHPRPDHATSKLRNRSKHTQLPLHLNARTDGRSRQARFPNYRSPQDYFVVIEVFPELNRDLSALTLLRILLPTDKDNTRKVLCSADRGLHRPGDVPRRVHKHSRRLLNDRTLNGNPRDIHQAEAFE